MDKGVDLDVNAGRLVERPNQKSAPMRCCTDHHARMRWPDPNTLDSHERATNVTYAGLQSSRYRQLVEKYLPLGTGAVFSFDCAGGREGGQSLIRAVQLWSHLANVGDAKSLIIHPASTTHRQLSDAELEAAAGAPRHRQTLGRRRVSPGSDLGSRACAGAGEMIDLARYQDPLMIQRVLHGARTIAIVGLSSNELRPSNFVGFYLKRHGYDVVPVNPRETEILGQRSYPSLLDVPVPVDIVDVFRTPDALPEIAREAVEIKAGALWCQFGVINEEGVADRGRWRLGRDRRPLFEGRARALHRPDALAGVQHRPDNVGPPWPTVASRRRGFHNTASFSKIRCAA